VARATFVVELDIDQDGTYGTNITDDVKAATIFRGRDDYLDSARAGRLSVTLNNSTGQYSPRGASVITENSVALTTLVPIRVRTTAPSTTTQFTGFITSISVDPVPKSQEATIEATDSMVMLERAIISQRLMQGQPTELIIHRLIDAAEGEPFLGNPCFDEDTSGWAISGGVSALDLSTDSLEGQYSGKVTKGLFAGAIEQDLPLSEVLGKTLVASGYVIADGTAAIGNTADIEIREVGPTGGDNFQNATLSAGWQRVETERTIGTAATRVYISSVAGVGAYSWRLGAAHVVEKKSSIPRKMTGVGASPGTLAWMRGNTNLPYYGPLRVPAMSAIDEVRDNELGGLFYINGGGTAVYEQRTARWASTVSLGTVDETFYKMNYSDDAEDRISKISFTYGQPDIGAPATYIWELELPISRYLAPSSTAVIWADYGYLAKDVTRPVAGTDYRLNSRADGGGVDMTGTAYGTFSWIPYGMGARFQFVNGGTAAYHTQLAVRATPIRQASDLPLVEYTPANPPSLTSELEHDYPLNDNRVAIEKWAEFLGGHYDGQRESMSVTLRPRTTAQLQQMLSRNISDIVTLTNNDKAYSTGINGNYYIESIRHSIRAGAFLHETTWAVTKVQDEVFAIWDSSSWDGAHVWAP